MIATSPADHKESAVVAATTGPANPVAHALCRIAQELHHYPTRKPGLAAVARIETASVPRTYRAAATLRPGRPHTGGLGRQIPRRRPVDRLSAASGRSPLTWQHDPPGGSMG